MDYHGLSTLSAFVLEPRIRSQRDSNPRWYRYPVQRTNALLQRSRVFHRLGISPEPFLHGSIAPYSGCDHW